MKKLNGNSAWEKELTEIEPYQAPEYEAIEVNGHYPAFGQEDEKQIIWKFLGSIRKHMFLIVLINLLVTGAVIIYVAQKPDFYQSEIRIQVNGEMNPAAGITSNGGSIIVNQTNDPAYFSTQLQILEGVGLLRRVANNLDLENNPKFLNPQGEQKPTAWQNVKRLFGFYPEPVETGTEIFSEKVITKNQLSLSNNEAVDPDAEAEKLAPYVSVLSRGLSVNPVFDQRTHSGETRLIEVTYTHGDPETAAKIVNEIGDVYVVQNLENKIKSNTTSGDFLQKRVAELQSLIRQGEERLINYAKNNRVVPLEEGQNTVVQRYSALNQQLGQAENDRIAAQTAYQAALQNKMRETSVQSQDPQVATLENNLRELRQRLAQLKTEYTDEWHEVIQVKKQIQLIENQLPNLRSRATNIQMATLEEKLNEAVARERILRENFEIQRGEVVRQSEASINYRIIQQDINTNKKLLDDLLQRSKENDLILNRTPNNVQVVDRAVVQYSPVGPQRAKDIAMAFIVSLGFGIGLAFVIDWFNDSVQHSENVESLFGLPILAEIPAAPIMLSRKLLPGRLGKRRGSIKNYNLKAFDKTEFQESYLQLGTQLLLSTPGGPPRTILIASGDEGEGKTLTALNLAKSLAESGKKVLLIDTDLRCPKIHKLIEQDNVTGLTTLLTASNLTDELIEETIKQNAAGSLDVLTSGERSANPAALLNSNEMIRLIKMLSSKYSQIVIDSPPVLYFADSMILSTLTDAVLVVVRDNHTSKSTVLQVKKMLQTLSANIVGIVMNGVPLKWSAYYKYRDYELDDELPVIDSKKSIFKLN